MTGAELRDLRVALGMTQAELAARLDVHVTTVCRWERGARPGVAPDPARAAPAIVALAMAELARQRAA